MSMWNRLAALAVGLMLIASPASAQKTSSFPTASPLAATDFLNGLQGTGCATSVAPCANVKVTPDQIVTYANGKIGTTFGRSILNAADAPSTRTLLGVSATGADTSYPLRSNNLSDLANVTTARGNISAAKSGANSDITSLTGLTTPLSISQGGTGAISAQGAAAGLGAGYILCKSAVAASVTGTTTTTSLATCTVPAAAMGPNGQIEVVSAYTVTNDANSKTIAIKFGGTQVGATALTTSATAQLYTRVANRNATNSQVAFGSGIGFTTSSGAMATAAIDTTASTTVAITCTLANTSDTCTLESYLVRLIYGS